MHIVMDAIYYYDLVLAKNIRCVRWICVACLATESLVGHIFLCNRVGMDMGSVLASAGSRRYDQTRATARRGGGKVGHRIHIPSHHVAPIEMIALLPVTCHHH